MLDTAAVAGEKGQGRVGGEDNFKGGDGKGKRTSQGTKKKG